MNDYAMRAETGGGMACHSQGRVMVEGQVRAAGQPWTRRRGRAGRQHQARLDSMPGRHARAGRDGGGTRDQAPRGFFFGISLSHFFDHMRFFLAL